MIISEFLFLSIWEFNHEKKISSYSNKYEMLRVFGYAFSTYSSKLSPNESIETIELFYYNFKFYFCYVNELYVTISFN